MTPREKSIIKNETKFKESTKYVEMENKAELINKENNENVENTGINDLNLSRQIEEIKERINR